MKTNSKEKRYILSSEWVKLTCCELFSIFHFKSICNHHYDKIIAMHSVAFLLRNAFFWHEKMSTIFYGSDGVFLQISIDQKAITYIFYIFQFFLTEITATNVCKETASQEF